MFHFFFIRTNYNMLFIVQQSVDKLLDIFAAEKLTKKRVN